MKFLAWMIQGLFTFAAVIFFGIPGVLIGIATQVFLDGFRAGRKGVTK